MRKIIEIEDALENFKKYLMPANFTDINAMIKKYGHDINDDILFFILSSAIIHEHEALWTGGQYDQLLKPILQKIDKERARYGLQEDEDWRINEAPQEVEELRKKYDEIFDTQLVARFKHYGLNDFANLLVFNKKAFDKRIETIKTQQFGKWKDSELIFTKFEAEAQSCAEILAFNAAAIMLSAAIEGVLLEVGIKNRDFLEGYMKFNKNRKKKKYFLSLTLAELITIFESMKLFPFDLEKSVSGKMLSLTKDIRNLIHPGRRISSKVHDVTENEYNFLYKVYMDLKTFYLDKKQNH
ncbi:hypothetical protein [Legionella longbeachae]|uniref:hypothetical protein n=1 Tax=Legionella longbeachae TaxID=450 RepID=UPI00399C6E54